MFKGILFIILFASLSISAEEKAPETPVENPQPQPQAEAVVEDEKSNRGMFSFKREEFQAEDELLEIGEGINQGIVYETTVFKEIGISTPKWKKFSLDFFALLGEDGIDKIKAQVKVGGLLTFVETGTFKGTFHVVPGRTVAHGSSSTGSIMLPSRPTFESEVKSYKIGYEFVNGEVVKDFKDSMIIGFHYREYAAPNIIVISKAFGFSTTPDQFIDDAFVSKFYGVWLKVPSFKQAMEGKRPALSLFHTNKGSSTFGLAAEFESTFGIAKSEFGPNFKADYESGTGRTVGVAEPDSGWGITNNFRAGGYYTYDVRDFTLGAFLGIEGEKTATAGDDVDTDGANGVDGVFAQGINLDGTGFFFQLAVTY